jgi:hypothetical protein
MSRFAACLIFAFSILVSAQAAQIKGGSTVYLEPANGYETYLSAAIVKKHVPLTVVTDRDKADYTITSSVSERAPRDPAIVINNNVNDAPRHDGFPTARNFGRTNASISVIDNRSSAIVFAYSVGKSRDTNQLQSAAEACAKHLKEFIEKSEKTKN